MHHPSIDQQITFLDVRDLQASSHFYEIVMGFNLTLDQGCCRIYRTSSNSYLGICEREDVGTISKGVIFTLVTSDVDGWYSFLKENGISFDNPPILNTQYQIYHFFLRDPNGYLIEIQRFEDPDWMPGA